MNAGVDSLNAASFVEGLRVRTALQLPDTVVFEHSTADALADYLTMLQVCRVCSWYATTLVTLQMPCAKHPSTSTFAILCPFLITPLSE